MERSWFSYERCIAFIESVAIYFAIIHGFTVLSRQIICIAGKSRNAVAKGVRKMMNKTNMMSLMQRLTQYYTRNKESNLNRMMRYYTTMNERLGQ